MNILSSLAFWKKFARYTVFGLLILSILAGSSMQSFAEVLQRAPQVTLAEDGDLVVDPATVPMEGSLVNPAAVNDQGQPLTAQELPNTTAQSNTNNQGQPTVAAELPSTTAQSSGGVGGGSSDGARVQGQGPKVQGQGPTVSKSCVWERKYPECDWNTHQVRVVYQNTCTGAYDLREYQYQEGQCGYSTGKPAAPAPQSVPQTAPQTMTVCNGQVKTWEQLQSELHVAGYPGPWDQGSALAAYNRAACPAPAPVQQAPVQPAAPVCVAVTDPSGLSPQGNIQAGTQTLTWNAASNASEYRIRIDDMTANGWTGNCNSVNAGDVCNDHVSGTSYSYTFQAGHQYHWWVEAANSCSTSNSINVYATVPAPVETPRPTPAPAAPVQVVQAQAPTQAAQTTQQCPNGSYMTFSGTTIVCVSQTSQQQVINNNVNTVSVPAAPAPQVVYATAPAAQPQVVYTAAAPIQQLPKTGLPVAAWFLTGLMPVGMRLKRFGKAEEGSVNNGLYAWQSRQMMQEMQA